MAGRNRSPHRNAESVVAYEESGRAIRLVFDTWTPRAHFVLTHTYPKADATPAELQEAYGLIARFLNLNTSSEFNKDAILSFHRGKWYKQNTGHWHAHLCVPKPPYIELAKDKITNIPQIGQWRNARTVREALDGYDNRKITEYRGYKESCIQTAALPAGRVTEVPLSTFNSNDYQLVWTAPDPRIGVIARSPNNSTLASLYDFMSRVIVDAEKELNKRDRNFANFGCHLCLYVSAGSGTNVMQRQGRIFSENGNLSTASNLVGYIQMDASEYVQWLPTQIKQTWLGEFRRVDHIVHT